MQVRNGTPYVRVVQHARPDPKTGEHVVKSFPVESGGVAHIPDDIWAEVSDLDPKRLWGLQARPDEKLETTKVSASEAISLVIACSDPAAIEGALRIEERKSVVAALHARAEEIGAEVSD